MTTGPFIWPLHTAKRDYTPSMVALFAEFSTGNALFMKLKSYVNFTLLATFLFSKVNVGEISCQEKFKSKEII